MRSHCSVVLVSVSWYNEFKIWNGGLGMRQCVLYDRECMECGECNLCDLDSSKICDNCKKCIGLGDTDMQYRAIKIDGIIDENMNAADYMDV